MIQGTVIWPNGANVKRQPNVNGVFVRTLPLNATIVGIEAVPDSLYPNDSTKVWIKLGENEFVAAHYPNNSGIPQMRILYNEIGFPPPNPIPTPKHVVELYIDGIREFRKELFT